MPRQTQFRALAASFSALLLAAGLATPSRAADNKLRVFFIDVEGGQSTLFITPAGQSLLVDTGWPGSNGRDADRIVKVAHEAGLSKIDYVLITHYHVDHVGGVPQLVSRIPIGTFIDHGENRELDKGITEDVYKAFRQVVAGNKIPEIHPVPGDALPIKGMTVTVVSEDGKLIATPLLGGGGQNAFCKGVETRSPDQTENARSLGIEINFGTLRLLDLGDLTWDKEMELMCPIDKLGPIDINIVSHHGWSQSSSPALVNALHARVAIMDNGAKKGGSTPTLKTIRAAMGLETLWQLHYSEEGGEANNTATEFIANPQGPDDGNYLELIASPDGSFDVLNARTKVARHYKAAH